AEEGPLRAQYEVDCGPSRATREELGSGDLLAHRLASQQVVQVQPQADLQKVDDAIAGQSRIDLDDHGPRLGQLDLGVARTPSQSNRLAGGQPHIDSRLT